MRARSPRLVVLALVALVALRFVAAAFGGAHTNAATTASPVAGQACARTVHAELLDVAQRIYDQAAGGGNVASSQRRLAASRGLAAAVARDDPAATQAALRQLLRAQIQRIEVTHGTRVLADLGSGAALAPVRGVIRDARGTPVGRYVLSVGADDGIAGLIHAITGAQVVMRAGGRTVATSLGTASGDRHAVSSFAGTAFPTGALRISLLSPTASAALCAPSRAATVANVVGAIGERLFRDEQGGAATARVLSIVAGDAGFARAVADDDPERLRAAIVRFFRDPSLHVVRIRAVTATGRLVNDVGGPYVLAPASAPVRLQGRTVGRVTLSIQDDTGFIKLMHRFTGADVVLRTPPGPVPGSIAPAPGRSYQAFAFTAEAFPSGPLEISLLTNG